MSDIIAPVTVIWDRHAIRAAIMRRGETLRSLGVKAGLSPDACRLSLQRPSPTADKAISDFLGVPLHELWPDRYDGHGNRLIKPRTRRKAQLPAPPLAA